MKGVAILKVILMPKKKLIVYSDFICPFCYLGKVNAERLQADHPELEIEWREFELHPEGQPDPRSPYMQQAQAAVVQLTQQYGIEMKPEVLTQVTSASRKALLGLEYAREQGREEAYRDAVFEAYWIKGRNIDDIDELGGIATDAGLDEQAFRAAVESGAYLSRLQEAMAEAHRQGIRGVPTYISGGYMLAGAQPVEKLRQLIDAQNENHQPTGSPACGREHADPGYANKRNPA